MPSFQQTNQDRHTPVADEQRSPAPVTDDEIAAARRVIEDAMRRYADDPANVRHYRLAVALAENVRGWTHTTRLRDFLTTATR